MAHGDYDCCAICDCKLHYVGFDATTKEKLCTDCAINLMKQGVEARNGAALLAWMRSEDPAKVHATLQAVGIQKCYYENAIDDEYRKVLEALTAARS